jgi:hypothetical protein
VPRPPSGPSELAVWLPRLLALAAFATLVVVLLVLIRGA